MRVYDLDFSKRGVKRKIETKHGLSIDEARRAHRERNSSVRGRGDVKTPMGQDPISGKYITIIGRVEGEVIKVITARKMTDGEKKLYRKKRG